MADCLTCRMSAARDVGAAPLWDNIIRTPYWDLVHSYSTSLPGWMVLVVRRHIEAMGDLTDAEAAELGPLLRDVSIALAAVTGCRKTYVIQFAEAADHPHVHIHIVPRMADLPAARRSVNIFSYLGVPEEERVSEAEMERIAGAVRQYMAKWTADDAD